MQKNFGRYSLTKKQFESFKELAAGRNSNLFVVGNDRRGYRIRNEFSVFGDIYLNSFGNYVVDLSQTNFGGSVRYNFLKNALDEVLNEEKIFSAASQILPGQVLKFEKKSSIYVPVYPEREIYVEKSFSPRGRNFVPKRKIVNLYSDKASDFYAAFCAA